MILASIASANPGKTNMLFEFSMLQLLLLLDSIPIPLAHGHGGGVVVRRAYLCWGVGGSLNY